MCGHVCLWVRMIERMCVGVCARVREGWNLDCMCIHAYQWVRVHVHLHGQDPESVCVPR